jgi:hypothetical protein
MRDNVQEQGFARATLLGQHSELLKVLDLNHSNTELLFHLGRMNPYLFVLSCSSDLDTTSIHSETATIHPTKWALVLLANFTRRPVVETVGGGSNSISRSDGDSTTRTGKSVLSGMLSKPSVPKRLSASGTL